jgi:hypothetical protein
MTSARLKRVKRLQSIRESLADSARGAHAAGMREVHDAAQRVADACAEWERAAESVESFTAGDLAVASSHLRSLERGIHRAEVARAAAASEEERLRGEVVRAGREVKKMERWGEMMSVAMQSELTRLEQNAADAQTARRSREEKG